MVKEVVLDTTVTGYAAQVLFELVYGGNGAFLRCFHKDFNGDPDASVGKWEGDQRIVSFSTPVDAPAFIRRMIGTDSMRVVETQRRTFGADGHSATLTSTPVLDMPGGAKLCTQVVLQFRDAADGGACEIHAVVTCTASGPYGLTGTIEAFMADAGRKSLQEFLDAVQAYAQAPEAAAAAVLAAVTPVPSVAAAAAPAAAQAAELPEQFFDAVELPLLVAPAMGDGLCFEDAALLYLRYMCCSGDQIVGLLQALELQLRTLQDGVAELREAAEERRWHRGWLPELPDTISMRQALLGAALLASSSAAAVLMWSRQHQHRAA